MLKQGSVCRKMKERIWRFIRGTALLLLGLLEYSQLPQQVATGDVKMGPGDSGTLRLSLTTLTLCSFYGRIASNYLHC